MNKKNIPIVTTILIIINIAVFLVMEFTGSTENTQFLYEHGAMYWPAVLEDGQWYRLITHGRLLQNPAGRAGSRQAGKLR